MVACTNSAKRPVFRLTSKLGEFKNFCMKSSTFNILLHFLQVFLSVLFWKSTKNVGSRVQHSMLPLFKSRYATSFSRCASRRSLLVAMLGAARTRDAQTSCHLFQALLDCSLCLPTLPFRPWRGITFCNESPIAHFTAYYGNIKETPAPLKITAWTLLVYGNKRGLFAVRGVIFFFITPYRTSSGAP